MSRTERGRAWHRCPGWPCDYCVEGKEIRREWHRAERRKAVLDQHLAVRDPEHPEEIFDDLKPGSRRR